MAVGKQNIEDLFKTRLKDYSVNPSNSVWNRINTKLNVQNYFKFSPGKFNVYYTLLIGVVVSLIILNPFENKPTAENNSIQKNKQIIIETIDPKIDDLNEESLNENITKNIDTINNIENEKHISDISTKNILTPIKTETNIVEENKYRIKIIEKTAKEELNVEDNKKVKLAKHSADFSVSENIACVPVAIHFINASENCDSYIWNFGNGETSSDINPTFVFRTAGVYTVTLTVKAGSISKSVSKQITINPKPESEFIISKQNNLYENDEVKFANLSQVFSSCKWNFGDENTSSSTHPTHQFKKSGYYNISLISFTENQCSDTFNFENLYIKDSKYIIIAPNAFCPDKNGPGNGIISSNLYPNNIFFPIFKSDVAEYNLKIYNKFGSVVFESMDSNFGWNGYIDNKPALEAVYIWKCTGKFSDGEPFIKTGNLTLLYSRNQ